MLKIGDRVDWRGSWGKDVSQRVTITGIEYVAVGEKYGIEVEAMSWDYVADHAVVELDNGHWSYGKQISRAPRP